jgi:hypothetical protein
MKTNEWRVLPGRLTTEEAWAPLAAHCASAAVSVLCGFAFVEEKKNGGAPGSVTGQGEMAVNAHTAKTLGLTIPDSILLRARRGDRMRPGNHLYSA